MGGARPQKAPEGEASDADLLEELGGLAEKCSPTQQTYDIGTAVPIVTRFVKTFPCWAAGELQVTADGAAHTINLEGVLSSPRLHPHCAIAGRIEPS